MVDLSGNHFGGELPNSITNLSSTLVTLRLGSNQLIGSILEGFNNLVNLAELEVEKINLTGGIPLGLCNLKMLQKLDLSENSFYGPIISSLTDITQLYLLHLQKNHITFLFLLVLEAFRTCKS